MYGTNTIPQSICKHDLQLAFTFTFSKIGQVKDLAFACVHMTWI